MTEADRMIFKFNDPAPITTVCGAIGFAIWEATGWTEYVNSKNEFLYVVLRFDDGSRLWVHRNGKAVSRNLGKITSRLNLYTHAIEANEEKLNDTGI